MTCVVCGAAITEPVFANAWEKTRKVSACCSAACAQTFDPDQHWLPSTRPLSQDPMEEARLARVGAERLRKGDRPSVVARELLIAGVGLPAVRKLLNATDLGSESTDAAKLTPIAQGGWRGRLLHLFASAAAPDTDDAAHLAAAKADLDRWAAHFA